MVVESTATQDLRNAVLAENVHIFPTEINGKQYPNMLDVTFDFLCPNCGKRHWATEIACCPVISVLGIQLRCGWVGIRMPWAETPQRDRKSIIYGQEEEQ